MEQFIAAVGALMGGILTSEWTRWRTGMTDPGHARREHLYSVAVGKRETVINGPAVLVIVLAAIVLSAWAAFLSGWPPEPDKASTAPIASDPAPGGDVEVAPTILDALPEAPRVLVVGDSIAAGFDVTKESLAWPRALVDSMPGDPELSVVAQPGATVGEVASLDRPRGFDLVLVELGTNNAGQGLPLKRYRSDVRSLLSDLGRENPGAPVLLLGPWIQDFLAEPYDEAGEELCVESDCTFEALSDAYTQSGPVPEGREVARGTSDGFHPGDEGHALIAEQILAAMS